MNLIFLDVDFVLTSTNYAIELKQKTGKTYSNYDYPIDPKCLNNLCELVMKIDAKIVITSTWRKEKEGREKLQEILRNCGLEDRVIGYTPILNGIRGTEILEFLKGLDGEVRFIILDDDIGDMEAVEEHLIQTNMWTGLTEDHVKEAIQKFEKMKEKTFQKSFSLKNT